MGVQSNNRGRDESQRHCESGTWIAGNHVIEKNLEVAPSIALHFLCAGSILDAKLQHHH
jgi:hypothetical protein